MTASLLAVMQIKVLKQRKLRGREYHIICDGDVDGDCLTHAGCIDGSRL